MATSKKTKQAQDNGATQLQVIEPGFITARAAVSGGIVMGKPSDEDMEMINRLSMSGRVDPDGVYRFDCVPSTQNVDSYYTRMDTTSLINYATEAKLGVPVLNSHRSGGRGGPAELPIGRSFNGVVENDPDNPKMQRFRSSAYMLRGNMANGSVNTNDIIEAIEAGTVNDISIGFAFSAGTPDKNFDDRTILRCSICGNDFLRSDPWGDDPDDCPHWPGEVYKTNGGKNQELCVLDVVNAHLSEYSVVYNGATPGAIILKAQRAAQEGKMERGMIHRLEDMYRTRLVDYAVFQVPVIGETNKSKEQPETAIETRKEKTEGTPDIENVEIPTNNQERIDTEMADKRELENAREDGAKHALAELAKSVMTTRSFGEDELVRFAEIENHLAAGEIAQAQTVLMRLINPPVEDGECLGEFYATDEGQRAEGEGEEAAPVNLISLGLTVNERQQFETFKRENAQLKAENKRLAPLAVTGERYRQVLVEQTCVQAVRANMGTETDTLDMLQHLPVEHIERIYNQYKQLGDARLGQHEQDEYGNLILTGQGGRQTTPADPNQPNFGQALNVAAQRAGVVRRNDFKAYR